MKKILIATTALVATAGFAAAEVKISGAARFGLMYNSDPTTVNDSNFRNTGNTSKTRLEKRLDVTIDGSTTADNGVTFGARLRIRSEDLSTSNAVGLAGRASAAGARLYARSGGLEVAVGNIEGAIEVMPGVYAGSVGLTGLSWGGLVAHTDRGGAFNANQFDWDAYSSGGAGNEGIEVKYAMGDFKGHLSYSSADLNGVITATKRVAAWGSYTFSGWDVTLGLQDSDLDSEDKVILTAGGKIGDFGIGLGVAQLGKGAKGLGGKITKYVLNGSYTMGATTVSAYVSNQNVLPVATGSKTQYGLGVAYAMGGGARIVGGVERTTRKTTRADLGVAFSF